MIPERPPDARVLGFASDLEVNPSSPACDRRGCEELGVARPVFRVWHVGWPEGDRDPEAASVMALDLKVCPGHAETTTVDDLMTDEGWASIVLAFRASGVVEPDRSTLELHMEPLSRGPVQ